ncbi:uncharacterized protein BDZ99DRAFT_503797 [Mytilinidion resinicola]|uniref:F-box domain-containing protein n=1 Tax=Mytilinidion resinicola TaxID=574789 RepID=A0A6A6Y1B6_9PEZI|nr:uncharacterized protein BDZ99DRAFT_503797 [Mytilinidion resinicola]KAF2802601.1 hypothetical protein BDZ99DRAFT_503797 [Mytilinidion resinicola]
MAAVFSEPRNEDDRANEVRLPPVTTTSSNNDSSRWTTLTGQPADAQLTSKNLPTTKKHKGDQDMTTEEQEEEAVERPSLIVEKSRREHSLLNPATTHLERIRMMHTEATPHRLPAELLHSIFKYLPAPSIRHVRSMSKRFADIDAEYLFPDIVVRFSEESFGRVKTIAASERFVKAVRYICIQKPFDMLDEWLKVNMGYHCLGELQRLIPFSSDYPDIAAINCSDKHNCTSLQDYGDMNLFVRIYWEDLNYFMRISLKSNIKELLESKREQYRAKLE